MQNLVFRKIKMKTYLFLLAVLLLVLLQGSILSWNLLLLLILFRAALKPDNQTFLWAFASGLLLDLGKGTPLGLSSLIFLFGSLILFLYARKFEAANPFFLTAFVFLINLLSRKIIFGYNNWLESLFLAFLTLLTAFFWQRRIGRNFEKRIKLRSLS
jgi:rod shape-determining protein MreD